MYLDDYIAKLQELRSKYGNVKVVKETHPYPDDWDDSDEINDASTPRFAQLLLPENNDVFRVVSNYDPNYASRTDETVVLL